MTLFDGDALEGRICPECVLIGPRGAAEKVRGRVVATGRNERRADKPKGRDSWIRLLARRARLLDAMPSFSLAARQAAVRETRERR